MSLEIEDRARVLSYLSSIRDKLSRLILPQPILKPSLSKEIICPSRIFMPCCSRLATAGVNDRPLMIPLHSIAQFTTHSGTTGTQHHQIHIRSGASGNAAEGSAIAPKPTASSNAAHWACNSPSSGFAHRSSAKLPNASYQMPNCRNATAGVP